MKTRKTWVTLPASLLAAAGLLLAILTPAFAAPAITLHKKDGALFIFAAPLRGDLSESELYMWIESFPAWTFKDQADGSLWWKASANIASVHIGTLVPETGLLGEVLFSGTGSIVNVGLWVPTVDGWFMPSEERTNWHIKATVFDDEGNEWSLYWQYVMRDGKVNETYRFEPAK